MLDIKAYLERINYRGALLPAAETLRALQVAHLLTVPFENLSIHAGQAILLEDDALFTKIVTNRRGGFCYEANGLFAALLRALGFNVAMLSAEVANATGEFGPAFDHMALLVQMEQRWLADVGFGDSFLEPLLLDKQGEQRQGSRTYRILQDTDYFVLMRRDECEWNLLPMRTIRECAAITRLLPSHISPEAASARGRPRRVALRSAICVSSSRPIVAGLRLVMSER
jgi:N-hydroxyarylamine O-acetyltransferase